MKTSLKNYTFRYLTISLLVVLTIWAILFRGLILDEVYDNVDDGLKNQKIEIIRESYLNPEIVHTNEFGLAQFRILPVSPAEYNETNRLTNELVFMPYDGEEEPYRVLRTGFYGKDGQPYSLEIRTSTVEEDDLIYDLTLALIFLYGFILVSILLINHYGLNKAFQPFDKIMLQLQHYRFGQAKKIEKVETNVTEFYVLQNEISAMVDRNEKVFNDQRLFIENASHELQTPLAIAINKLDLILEHSNLDEKDFVELAETKNSLWRMVNLNKSLLMLSRIENQHYAAQSEINFKTILEEMVEDYEPFFEAKEIKVDVDLSHDFIVEFNPDLARILISNLIRNAVKHNNDQKQIQIRIEPQQIIIGNTSHHGELNAGLIFNRFYKQGNSDGSTGLGLSIVDSILKNQNRLKLEYRYQMPFHQFMLKK